MTWPLGTEARNFCIGLVTSSRPVGSIDPGTSATWPGGTATVGGVTVGRDEVGGVIVGVVVGDDLPLDPPPQAPQTATITAASAQKGLQARSGRVDPKVM